MLLAASEGVGTRTPVSLSRSDRGRKGGGARETYVSSLESSGNHVPRQLLVLLNDFLGGVEKGVGPARQEQAAQDGQKESSDP